MDAGSARDRDERLVLGIVDDDLAAEGACLRGREKPLEVALAEAATEPARDEDRLTLVGHTAALELGDRDRDCRLTGVLRSAGQRQRRRLDENRRPSSTCDKLVERSTGEREAQRVSGGRLNVDDPLGRRGWTEDHVVVARRNEDDARAREQWNATHGSYPIRP